MACSHCWSDDHDRRRCSHSDLPAPEARLVERGREYMRGIAGSRAFWIQGALKELPRELWAEVINEALAGAEESRRWHEQDAAQRVARAGGGKRVKVPDGWSPPQRIRARA